MKKLDEFLLVVYFTNFKIVHFPKNPLGLTILNNLSTTIKSGDDDVYVYDDGSSSGYGHGSGDGSSSGYGYGSGDGSGDGYGYGSGDGSGYGYGYGYS